MLSFFLALILVVTHLFAGHLRFLEGIPRSRWLSMAGGVSVAYVFLRLLPELSAGQETIRQSITNPILFLEHHVYLLALAGLVVFYGLERVVRASKSKAGQGKPVGSGIFWLHMGSFTIYNMLIGYLLSSQEVSALQSKALFAFAMALHFVVTDYGLREDHQDIYRRIGRWILAAAILVGWGIGMAVRVPELVLVAITAFLSGGIILNVMKEELPADRESRLLPFFLGVVFYSILLLVL